MDAVKEVYEGYKALESMAKKKGFDKQFDRYIKPHPLRTVKQIAKSLSGVGFPPGWTTTPKKKASRESSVTPQPKRRNSQERMDEDQPTASGTTAGGGSSRSRVKESEKAYQVKIVKARKSKGKRKRRESELGKLKKRVKKIAKEVKFTPTAKHVHYRGQNGIMSSVINQVNFDEIILYGPAQIEQALSTLPLNTPATGGAGSEANQDLTGVTRSTRQPVKLKGSVIFRNNYMFPVKFVAYEVVPKVDHSDAPQTCAKNVADHYNGTNIKWYCWPSESAQFNRLWKIVDKHEMVLNPGDEFEHFFKWSGVYNQEDNDDQAFTYLKKYSKSLLIRMSGTVCHDSMNTDRVGITDTRIDWMLKRRFELKFFNNAPTRTIDTHNDGIVAFDGVAEITSHDVVKNTVNDT